MQARRRAVLALAVLGLSGCAQLPVPEPGFDSESAWSERRHRLRELSDWSAIGRISIQTEDEAWNATVNWRQRGDSYRIRLMAPLGGGTVQLAGDGTTVTLHTPDNEVYRSRDADTLLLDTMGWRLPVAGLRYWILGIDHPDSPLVGRQLDALGQPASLEQDGWRIEYLRFTPPDDGAMPGKLYLEREQVSVRIVVNRWGLEG